MIKRLDNQEGKMSDDPIPKNSVYWLYTIIGARGRGKSTILLNLLNTTLKKYYDNIYLFSTTANMDDKFADLIEELENENKFINGFSEQDLTRVLEEIKEFNEDAKEPRNLIIFDDCISMFPKATEANSIFNKFIIGGRHYKTDTIITSQQFRRLNTVIRSNMDIITMFPTINKNERDAYIKELNVDKDYFIDLMDYVSNLNDKHTSITINFLNGRPMYYINFRKLKK